MFSIVLIDHALGDIWNISASVTLPCHIDLVVLDAEFVLEIEEPAVESRGEVDLICEVKGTL